MAVDDFEATAREFRNRLRGARVRRTRNALNLLAVVNLIAVVTWGFVRAFYCWDTSYCNPTAGLFSSLGCAVCQTDLLVVLLLFSSSILLVVMLATLYRHELPRPLADELEFRRSRVPGVRTVRSIHYSARMLDRDGPGWLTAVLIVLALGIAAFYLLTENRSFLCLWVFSCA